MYHRATAAASKLPSGTTLSSKKRRIKKRRRRSSESTQLMIVVSGTVLLTLIIIVTTIKLYNQFVQTSSVPDNADDDESKNIVPFNPKYRVPESMTTVGDRSDTYVTLRQLTDAVLTPNHPARSLAFTQSLQHPILPKPMEAHHSDSLSYDIYNCPEYPPPGYPYTWNLVEDVLGQWNPNDIQIPSQIHQSLCVFDFETDYDTAMNYRKAELPFVVTNDPQVAATVERWNHPGYLEKLLGQEEHRCEYSQNNHFMYYIPVSKKNKKRQHQNNNNKHNRLRVPEGWTEPTKLLRMTYRKWLQHANSTNNNSVGPDDEHWYFRLIGCGGMGDHCDAASSEYLFDELPFFQPRDNLLYIVEPDEQKGIHCRFGMKGVIAENHFDGSRNAIVVLGGSRRYILSHPNQCENLALYPKGHPSARHSAVDWTNPNLDEYPDFAQARGNEVVLLPGHVLYLPTEWFHFIVSLDLNFQCNTRSGITNHYADHIHQCGF